MVVRYPGPKPALDDEEAFELFVEVLQAAFGETPILGDLIEIITGKEDGNLDDLGTWINQIRTLLSGGTVSSPLPSLVGLGITNLFTMVNQIGEILNGLIVTPINSVVQGVKDWFAGLLGWRSTTDTQVAAAVVAADNANYNVNSVVVHAASLQGQVNSLNSALFYRSTRSMLEGIIPNAESTFDYWMLSVNSTNVTASPTSLPWAILRCQSDNMKNLLAFQATLSASGTLTAFYADVYVLNDDGSWAYFQSIECKNQLLAGSAMWVSINSAELTVGIDVVIGVQFRVVGTSVTVGLKALNLTTVQGIPGTYPGNVGMTRSTNNAPTTVAADGGTYNGYLIYLEYGNGEEGGALPPQDYYDGFTTNSGDWSSAGTKTLSITGGHVEIGSIGFGADVGYLLFEKSIRADDMEVSFTVGTSSQWSGAVMNNKGVTSNGSAPYVLIGTKNNTVAIMTTDSETSTSFTTRASASISTQAGRWVATYTVADNTYRVFRDGETTPVVSWVDTGNFMPHTIDRRCAGLFITGQLYTAGSNLDDFRFRDTYTI